MPLSLRRSMARSLVLLTRGLAASDSLGHFRFLRTPLSSRTELRLCPPRSSRGRPEVRLTVVHRELLHPRGKRTFVSSP